MTSAKNFIPLEHFLDPIKEKNQKIIYSQKFVEGSIFCPQFVNKELAKSKEAKTIVFDLDETMRGWDKDKNEGFLRDSLKKVLDELVEKNYRLVIWSASIRPSIQQTINKYPGFEDYFDLIISAENYCFPYLSEENKQFLEKVDPKYFKLLEGIDKNLIDLESGRPYYRPTKNIRLFGYSLLVDDDPGVIQEGEMFNFQVLRLFPYKYENPDFKDLVPEELVEEIESDFDHKMASHIIHAVENHPDEETMYLVED